MYFLKVTLCVTMITITTSYPTGAPGCTYSPADEHRDAYGRLFAPQRSSVPHNVKFDKSQEADGSYVLTIQGAMECPMDSVYVEDSFVGFLVKTTDRGRFLDTEGLQVLTCEGICVLLFNFGIIFEYFRQEDQGCDARGQESQGQHQDQVCAG